MTFSAYLTSKKIDEMLFEQHNPAKFQELKALFEEVHPESFTAQKKFLINDLRRLYLLKEKHTQ